MTSRYLVFSNPVEDRDDAYNLWYDTVHVPEVLALPGIQGAHRFVRSDRQRSESGFEFPFRYLAVYDLGHDPGVGLDSLRRSVLTPGTDIAPGVSGVVFDPR